VGVLHQAEKDIEHQASARDKMVANVPQSSQSVLVIEQVVEAAGEKSCWKRSTELKGLRISLDQRDAFPQFGLFL
jgi:hypothetical protein